MCVNLLGLKKKKVQQAQSGFRVCFLAGQISKSTMNFKGTERKKKYEGRCDG